jgi:hypothetical protein
VVWVDVVDLDVDLSVDLRDALGDRLYLTGTVRRDGVRLTFSLSFCG